jgi:hypothetical protein
MIISYVMVMILIAFADISLRTQSGGISMKIIPIEHQNKTFNEEKMAMMNALYKDPIMVRSLDKLAVNKLAPSEPCPKEPLGGSYGKGLRGVV